VFNEIEPDPVLNQTGFQMSWDISSTGGSTKLKNPSTELHQRFYQAKEKCKPEQKVSFKIKN
jgi:hypothetical protein